MATTLNIIKSGKVLKKFSSQPGFEFFIGKDPSCEIQMEDIESGKLKLYSSGSQWWIDDCKSNSLILNGNKVTCQLLSGKEEVQFAGADFELDTVFNPEESKDKTDELREFFYRKLQPVLTENLNGKELSLHELEATAKKQLNRLFDKNEGILGLLSSEEEKKLKEDIIADLLLLGPLEQLIANDDITEIMVKDENTIYIEEKGKIKLTDLKFRDSRHLHTVIERIVAPLGRRIDESSPLVDARLADGSRVNAVIPPIVPGGACLTIRKFGKDVFNIERLISYGSMTKDMGNFLEACVKLRKNIVVSGGTGSGKTSLLNAISTYLSEDERIITIEDSLELKLQQKHVIRMEARPPNAEGKGEVSIRDLVKNSLRMRPDRIVVGECRGGEALDMLQAMNTGHDGSLTTVHANSPKDTLSRLETLVLMAGMDLPLRAVTNQIASAVNIIVQTARLSDGSRRVISICEIEGQDDKGVPVLRELFKFKQTGIDGKNNGKVLGNHMPVNKPSFWDQFIVGGIAVDDKWFEQGGGNAPV